MSNFRSWHEALEDVRRERKDFQENLLRMEGECEAWSKSPNRTEQYIASAFLWLARESRIRESEDLSLLELFLNFFDSQAKEIETLKKATSTLDISDSSLKTEIDGIKTWKERREEILSELEGQAKKRRRWLNENR